MKGYDLYVKYVSHKAHFTSVKYDVRKYPTTGRTSWQAFQRRNDRSVFDYTAKGIREEDCEDFLKANFIHDPSFWIGNEMGPQIFVDWQKRNGSIDYTIRTDLANINHWRRDKNISWLNIIFSNYFKQFGLNSMVAVETFVIFNNLFSIFDYYDLHHNDFLWEQRAPSLRKYGLFYENLYTKDELKELFPS